MPVVLVEVRKNIAGNQLFLLSLLWTTFMQIKVYFWNVCVCQPFQYGMLMSWIYYQMYCRLMYSCITVSCCVLYSGLSDMKVVTLFITHVLKTCCHVQEKRLNAKLPDDKTPASVCSYTCCTIYLCDHVTWDMT